MSHIFCPSCGQKNDFVNGRKPNFCVSCGNNLQSLALFNGGQSTASRPATSRPAQTNTAMDISLDDDDTQEVEDAGFSKSDVRIDVPQQNKVKLGSLATQPKPEFSEARHDLNAKAKGRRNLKNTFEEFQKEAGKGGARPSEIGNGNATE